MKRTVRGSTYRNVVAVFLLLLIPFYIMSLLVYNRSHNVIKENILSYNEAQISNCLSILEQEIQHIRNQQLDLVSDSDLNLLAFSMENMTLYDVVLRERELQQKLEYIRTNSEYVTDARACLLSSGITVSARDGIMAIGERDADIIRESLRMPSSKIIAWNGGLYISLFYPYLVDVETFDSGFRGYSILIELDGRAVGDFINRHNTYQNANTVLQLSAGNMAIGEGRPVEQTLVDKVNRARGDRQSGYLNLTYDGDAYMVMFRHSPELDALMVNYVPESSAFEPLSFYSNWLAVFLCLTMAVIFAFAYLVYVAVHRPLRRLSNAFRKVESGDLNTEITCNNSDEFNYIYSHFNKMVETIRQLIGEVYEHKILMQQAELKQLQSKINPHFLYNAFFSISTIALAEGGEISSDLAQKLGKYFRFVTKEASERVPLANELEYARLYAEIQETRFSNRLRILFDELPEAGCGRIILPALILQPLIENSLEHGLRNKTEDGLVHVGFVLEEGSLVIFVEDNGEEVTKQVLADIQTMLDAGGENRKPDALPNIFRRIQITFANDGRMEVLRGPMGGLRVELRIPTQIENKEEEPCTGF